MNALILNRVTCAEPGPCCQPGEVFFRGLEFCEVHAFRRMMLDPDEAPLGTTVPVKKAVPRKRRPKAGPDGK